MKRENQLILELCRFLEPDGERLRALLEEPLDGPYVLGQLLYHRVGGVAYHTLVSCGLLDRLHRECRNSLRTVYEAGAQQTASLHHVLADLGEVLEGAPFPYAVLKGAFLARLYPAGLRTSNDIDVLVGGQDISALAERLTAAGYRQGYLRGGMFTPATRTQIVSARMNRGETVPFLKRVDLPGMTYSEIDVNFSLDYKARRGTTRWRPCWHSAAACRTTACTHWGRRISCCICARICIRRRPYTTGWRRAAISHCTSTPTYIYLSAAFSTRSLRPGWPAA